MSRCFLYLLKLFYDKSKLVFRNIVLKLQMMFTVLTFIMRIFRLSDHHIQATVFWNAKLNKLEKVIIHTTYIDVVFECF